MYKKILLAMVLVFLVVASVVSVPQVIGACEPTGNTNPC